MPWPSVVPLGLVLDQGGEGPTTGPGPKVHEDEEDEEAGLGQGAELVPLTSTAPTGGAWVALVAPVTSTWPRAKDDRA